MYTTRKDRQCLISLHSCFYLFPQFHYTFMELQSSDPSIMGPPLLSITLEDSMPNNDTGLFFLPCFFFFTGTGQYFVKGNHTFENLLTSPPPEKKFRCLFGYIEKLKRGTFCLSFTRNSGNFLKTLSKSYQIYQVPFK